MLQQETIIILEQGELGKQYHQIIRDADAKGSTIHVFDKIEDAIWDDFILLTAVEKTGYKINSQKSFILYCTNQEICQMAVVKYGRLYRKAIATSEKEKEREYLSGWGNYIQIPEGYQPHQITIFAKNNSKYHVYEPFVGEVFVLDEEGKLYKEVPERIEFHYQFLEEVLNSFQDMVKKRTTGEGVVSIYRALEDVSQNREQIGEVQLGMFLIALENYYTKLDSTWDHLKVLFLSLNIYMTNNGKYLEEYNRIVLENKIIFTRYNKYFYWRQQWRIPLKIGELSFDSTTGSRLYESIYEEYHNTLKTFLEPIKKEKRNKDRVVVLVIQFLEETHAPTRTALERCETLTKMGKEVLIINTREQLTLLGMLPVFDMEAGRIFEHYSELAEYSFHDETFSFFQTDQKMPETGEIIKIMQMIRDWNPYFVLTMGTGSIVSDLVSNVVPVINIPLAFSTMVKKQNQFCAVGKKIDQNEWKALRKSGYNPEAIIECTFTFDIKPQHKKLTREMLQLPQQKFLLAVVGLRLGYEILDDFICAMIPLFKRGAHLVFAGYFDKYQEICKNYPEIAENSSFVGYQDDILALYEIVNLYVNPKRLGGGFSIAEAFSKGKPGVTINYGDVAAAAGHEFCVENYQEMQTEIIKYMTNATYYEEMVLKGYKRVAQLTDSSSALEYIIKEAENRTLFF